MSDKHSIPILLQFTKQSNFCVKSVRMSVFKKRVIEIVGKVPYGTVVSYGQVALIAGVPRAARQVGWVLNQTEGKDIQIPWWRVVNNAGRVSIKGTRFNTADDQRSLLRSEGIDVKEDFTFDIEEYRFVPNEEFITGLGFDDDYTTRIVNKYDL